MRAAPTLTSRTELNGFAIMVAAGVGLWLVAAPARAQGLGGPGSMGSTGASSIDPAEMQSTAPTSPLSRPEANDHDDQGGDDKKDTSLPPPPSLPGSHAQPIPVAPARHNVSDMDPTAALFDAINRGDTEAARDALGRGADIEGKNVLGQTPLALSVDLGRNDISFLLLSMRTPPDAVAAATPPRLAHGKVTPVSALGKNQPLQPATVSAAAPSSGFLGFGGS
jgi:ankyrin repeat protein